MTRSEVIGLVIALTLVAVILIPSLIFSKIDTPEAVQIVLMAALVLVTIIYVKRTSDISEATREQSQEVKEQTIIASRPLIIQRAIYEKDIRRNSSEYFISFQIYNAGAGPAIELETLLLDRDRKLLQSETDTFLRAGAEPIRFNPMNLIAHINCTCYLLCRYRSTLFSATDERWYQTWMPFDVIRASVEDKLYVKPHRLEFLEVVGKESY